MPDPRTPRNTTRAMRDDPAENLMLLAESLGTGSPGSFIERQEVAGQREMVNSDVIPTEMLDCTEGDLTALGFGLGPVVDGDPLFRCVTLPTGWKREGSDHDMWSFIVDSDGYRRCSVFYKAAFYDRKAHISIDTVYSYVSHCLYEGTTPVVKGNWATRAAVLEEIEKARVYHQEKVDFWAEHDRPQYVSEHTEKVERCDEFKAAVERAS